MKETLLIVVTDTKEENFLLKELVTFTSNINGKNNQKKSLMLGYANLS